MAIIVYRVAKSILHARDISGFGAAKYGGRWNSKGTCIVYTGINSSLARLENLSYFDGSVSPPDLYIASIEIKDDNLIYELPDPDYPGSWQVQDNPENKIMGDQWINENKFLAFKVRSAINPTEFNFLLNPQYPGYQELININSIQHLKIDAHSII